MAKKVTVISTSIRPNSNSELLAKSFAEGAEATGNEVAFITLKDKDIRFCRGCLSCHQTGKCIIQDDVAPIMDAVLHADVVVWATPIYYFEMSGQMKTIIDRMNPMYPMDYRFRDVYFLATAADKGEDVFENGRDRTDRLAGLFPKTTLKGSVYCGGVTGGGEISGNAKLAEARALGAQV